MCYNERERVCYDSAIWSRRGEECQTVLYTDKDERRQKTGTSGANLNERVELGAEVQIQVGWKCSLVISGLRGGDWKNSGILPDYITAGGVQHLPLWCSSCSEASCAWSSSHSNERASRCIQGLLVIVNVTYLWIRERWRDQVSSAFLLNIS